jgi:hypothetical protein
MHLGPALLLLSIAATACASNTLREPVPAQRAAAAARAQPAPHAASRLGPPSPRGLGLRRIDRYRVSEAPLALY